MAVPLAAQLNTIESVANSLYPAQWPAGPSVESVPEWAQPGRIRFARWDGGRIETAKAILSGWPGFNPPDPNRLETMTNWYRPETVRFLREAGINMIWVTFSNGFSNQTEKPNQDQLRRYIDHQEADAWYESRLTKNAKSIDGLPGLKRPAAAE